MNSQLQSRWLPWVAGVILAGMALGVIQDVRRTARLESVEAAVTGAIEARRLLALTYDGMERIVEPHLLGLNARDQWVLSAWFVSGLSRSGKGPGWREYLMVRITDARVLSESFPGPRPGYQADGGGVFTGITQRL